LWVRFLRGLPGTSLARWWGLTAHRRIQRKAVAGDGEGLAGAGRCRGYRIAQGKYTVAGVWPENDPIRKRCGAELIEGVVDLQIEIGLIGVFDELHCGAFGCNGRLGN